MPIKSIFRYPGGKTKAIKYIQPFWEQVDHNEYREVFMGGGSVFIAKPLVKFNWINDIDKDLISFYEIIADKNSRENLIGELLNTEVTKDLYQNLFKSKPDNNFQRAKRYYILNRCSFSGITKWNSYIGTVRYNISSIQDSVRLLGEKLSKTKVTNYDFEKVIKAKPRGKENVFMFLDPPYAESRQVAAYSCAFEEKDHIRLAKLLKGTKYKFLLTYDDCEFIIKLYRWANLYSYTWTYSVANSRVHHNPRESGNELFISNFKLKELPQLELI